MNKPATRPARVRIAPSPTGDPHVGTGYIALFDYVFARHTGGEFVLRIEDTDRQRSNAESERQIFHSLRWLGLGWDEGPDVGGPHGPYRQSERAEIYREYAAQLIESGAAYPCFCTAERLAALREEQKRNKLSTLGYDKYCRRNVKPDEAKARMAAGEPHVIRLDVPAEGKTILNDVVRGRVEFENRTIDDQILIKSDGFPTYHLANVVDDHLMGITHVIRAEDWVSSTPKHLLLYEAFGWEPPVWVHMPLLRNPDKSKISKRKNPTSLLWYEEQGYLPEAIVNFLALMGWSVGEDREMFSIEEMIREFSWERVATSAPVFDLQKLDWLNGVYIREMTPEALAARLRESVLGGHPVEDDLLLRTIPLVQERMKKLTDYLPMTAFLFGDVAPTAADLVQKKSSPDEAAKVLSLVEAAMSDIGTWDATTLEERIRNIVSESGIKGRTVFMTIRVAVLGSPVSPPLFESMELVGRERTLARLRSAREMLLAA